MTRFTSVALVGVVVLATLLAVTTGAQPLDLGTATAASQPVPPQKGQAAYKRTRDVLYGRAYGTALTMDVFEPLQRPKNGAGILIMISGGWFSSPEAINPAFALPFIIRGYTVFAVVHGSQPKFTLSEIVEHVRRSVRFVRHNAKKYGIDPEKLGVTGGSAGGHLSLILGLAGRQGDASARDPVDREPARVSAVACFFPPTDFLNWGKPGVSVLDLEPLKFVWAAFDFQEFSKETGRFERLPHEQVVNRLRELSPVTHVDKHDPPVLIIHGDADKLVPLQQSRLLIEKLQQAGVPCKLVVKPNAGHGWPNLVEDLATCADWFDRFLLSDVKIDHPEGESLKTADPKVDDPS